MDAPTSRFRFNDTIDLHLAREVLGQNPFEDQKRWGNIQVNMIQITGKSLSVRTLKERTQNLIKKHLAKAKELEGKSGIEILVTEFDDIMQQISDLASQFKKTKLVEQTPKSSYSKGWEARDNAVSNSRNNGPSVVSDVNEKDDVIEIHETDLPVIECIEVTEGILQNVEIVENVELSQQTEPKTSDNKKSFPQANILGPKRKRTHGSIKQTTLQYLEKKTDQQYEIRRRELALQERKQALEEKHILLEFDERKKKMELEERRLEMEEKRLNIQLDLFSNQQELIKRVLDN